MIKDLSAFIAQVRKNKPLVHHITNYVTVNSCANITLAIGASPIMADAIGEAADVAAIASAVVINMGTLNEHIIPSMVAAGKSANAKGIPIVFDPAGAGASKLRNKTASQLIDKVKLSVLRGNISEIKSIAGMKAEIQGVDASESDVTSKSSAGQIAKALAKKLGCVVVISGNVDTISDGERIAYVENGVAMLGNLTGTGCMCSSLIGSLCGAVADRPFEAAVCAMLCMGIAGEQAYQKAGQLGNGSFYISLLDAVSLINADTIERLAKLNEA